MINYKYQFDFRKGSASLLVGSYFRDTFNKSYLTDSCMGFTLKMESVTKNTIFGKKMMVKSGLEKFILKSLHAWRNFKNIFSRPPFTIIFRPRIVFLNTDSILRVKTMYESVK